MDAKQDVEFLPWDEETPRSVPGTIPRVTFHFTPFYFGGYSGGLLCAHSEAQ